MRYLKYCLLIIIMFMLKIDVNATNMSMNISCPTNVYKNEIFSCNISVNAQDGLVNGITFNYSFENTIFKSFSQSTGWSPYSDVNSSDGISLGNISGVSGNSMLGKISFIASGNVGSSIKIGITNIDGSDIDYNAITSSNIFKTINIIEKTTTTTKKVTTTTTTTTTKPKNDKTTTTTTTTQPRSEEVTTTQTTTTAVQNDALLDSLNIEGVSIEFNKNKFEYEVNVGTKINFLNISATSNPENTISGLGRIPIHDGENTIIIRVTDKNRQTNTYTIKVVRKNNIVSNNKDEIIKAFESNEEVVINLKTTDNQIIDNDIVNIIKANDKKITYNIYKDNEILYFYEFNGDKIETDIYNDINLKINFNDKDNIIDNQIKDNKKIIFENEYKGYFPTGTKLNIKNINEKKEKSINLYKININNNLDLINSNVPKLNNNYFSFEIEKGSKYVLSSKKINENNFKSMIIISTLIIVIEIAIIGFLLLKVFIKKNNDKKDIF